MKAIEVHGTDWVKVAQAVPGRTNAQCRGRYMLSLNGGNAKETWDPEEDERSRAAVNKHGYQWEKVHEEMGATRLQTQVSTCNSLNFEESSANIRLFTKSSIPLAIGFSNVWTHRIRRFQRFLGNRWLPTSWICSLTKRLVLVTQM